MLAKPPHSLTVDLFLTLLQNPDNARTLDLQQWDLVVRQARRAQLLARLYYSLERDDLLSSIPEQAKWHFEAAAKVTKRHVDSVQWEVKQIYRALFSVGVPIVLLKGAAYVMAGLPPATGRVFVDVDIMVPKGALNDVERALKRRGWMATHHDEYDQRYYRQWMHELPPLKHARRQTVLDVHHTILPETARLHPDPHKLMMDAVPLDGMEDVYVFAPEDMVLHSATHLFHDGELEHGLRDLVDLDSLLRHFSQADGFWERLLDRAVEMELARPLYYALRYTSNILGTPVPDGILSKSRQGKPSMMVAWLMDQLFYRALKPDHASCRDSFTGLARWVLYIRAHYLRMPLHLLIPHLFYKSFITPYKERQREKLAENQPNLADFLKDVAPENRK